MRDFIAFRIRQFAIAFPLLSSAQRWVNRLLYAIERVKGNEDGKMGRGENVRGRKGEDEKMGKWESEKMRRCENVKMRRCSMYSISHTVAE